MSASTRWAHERGAYGLDRRQARRRRRRAAAAAARASTCDDCGAPLTHVVGPGLYRADWCVVCDADQLDAIIYLDDWLDHMEREHTTDTPDRL